MTEKNAKGIKNKDIASVAKTKDKVVNETTEPVRMLIAKRECEIPFVGSWKGGEEITDPEVIKKIGDNPNFEHIIQ